MQADALGQSVRAASLDLALVLEMPIGQPPRSRRDAALRGKN
jgi:hypothetical protein